MPLRFQVPPHESGIAYTSIGLGSHAHEVAPDGYFYCDECAALAAQLGWPTESVLAPGQDQVAMGEEAPDRRADEAWASLMGVQDKPKAPRKAPSRSGKNRR